MRARGLTGQAKKQREKKERIEAKKKMMAAKRSAAKEVDGGIDNEADNLVRVPRRGGTAGVLAARSIPKSTAGAALLCAGQVSARNRLSMQSGCRRTTAFRVGG